MNNNKNCELCQAQQQQQLQPQTMNKKLSSKTSDSVKSMRYPSPAVSTQKQLCQHPIHTQQLQLQQQQRSSSVGSTGSSICDSISSHTSSVLSPTEPNVSHQYLQPPLPPPSPASSQQPLLAHTTQLTMTKKSGSDVIGGSANPLSVGIMPTRASALSAALTGGIETAARTTPAVTPNVLPPGASTLPSQPPTPLVSGLGAAAMAANLAESFSLLHQQAYHFRDILYAAHLLGRGYYQPAGPLITTPHAIPPVNGGHALAPPPSNVSLPPTASDNKTKCPSATASSQDSEHIQLQQAGSQNTSNSTDTANIENDVIVTDGDLTPFRYSTQSIANGAAANAAAAHQHQQQQLHQQAAAAAAAAAAAVAAHPNSSYPRSMHAQMHYSPPYPANYYSPYPGEPICYSPPAYQPYFSSKVYQSAPPPHPPPPTAYRHYTYYQPGHPPPPADLYEQVPVPATPNGGQQSGSMPIQGAPPPSQLPGTQLVPAGQHLDHYPGPPTYYTGYNPAGTAASQCYTRSLQGPYMEYAPAQCPCPMQQSCPKNVHTGPHIGSNSSGNNSSSNISSAATNGNNNNNMAINHNNSAIAAIQQHSRNISSSSAQNNSVSSSNKNNNNSSNSKMQADNNSILNTNGINSNMLTTSRGPVKKCSKINVNDDEEAMRGIKRNLDLLSTTVKTEMKSEDFNNKSQYEESVVQPLTPLGNYAPKEHNYSHVQIISKDHRTPIPIFEDVEETIDKLQDKKMSPQSILPAHLLNENAIEEYDLTTTTPPLINGNYSGSNSNGSQLSGTAVVRRARIGKTMAREMVYAAANTISPSNGLPTPLRHPCGSSIPLLNNEMVTKRPALPAQPPPSQVLKNSSPAHNQPPMMTNILGKTNVTVPVAIPLVLKAEIKAEKIKLEDEILDKVLRQQTMSITQQPLPAALPPQMHINQEKIKAEPISLNEVLHESKVKLENDAQMKVIPAEKKVEEDIDIGKNMMVKKCKGRMRLLPSWQQPFLHCDVDLCNASDDEILDLCHSPPRTAPICNDKRIKTLDYSKLQCKKSPPNSYKNLIKQTEPKTYLCLSRKIDKKSRYGKLQTKSSKGNNSSSTVRRRELILTDQQKQRLRVRKKKLAAIERQKREARKIKKMEFKQKRKENKLDIAVAVLPTTLKPPEIIKIEPEAVIVNLIEEEEEQEQVNVNVNDIQNENCIAAAEEGNLPTSQPLFELECNETPLKSPRITSKASPKHLKSIKKPAIPQHIKETIDAVARGYFSEPETHGSILSFASSSSPKPPMHFPVIVDKLDFKENDLTFTKTQKPKINTEKRSKSETKKPIKIPPTTSAADARKMTVSLDAKVKKADTLITTTTINETLTGTTTSTHLQGAQLNENQKNNYSIKADGERLSTHKSKRKKCKKDKDKSKSKKSKSSRKDEKISKMKPESTTKASTNEIETVITMPSTEHLSPTINAPNNNELNVDGLPAAQIEITEIDDDSIEPEVSERAYIEVTKNAAYTMLQISEQQTAQHSYGLTMNPVFLHPPLPRIVCNSQYHQQHSAKRNRSRTKFGSRKRQKLKHSTVSFELDETLPPATRVDVVPKWNNGWTWEGKSFQGAVFLNSDDPLVLRTCYAAMRHVEGDIIRTRDCVLLKANEDNELPYVAKVAHLWENPEDGEMMMSLLWYYRPEHTEQGRQPNDSPDEVYASRHRDHNSVACIEDKCYVLTFSEYCRYRRRIRASEEDIEDVNIVPKRLNYLNTRTVPDNTNPELIMFCRRAYEFRTKRLLKMPNKQDYYVVKA